MEVRVVTLLLLALTAVLGAAEQQPPPCSSLLEPQGFSVPGEWRALLTIPVPSQPHAAAFRGWHLRLTFTQSVDELEHNVTSAMTTTVDDRNFVIRHRDSDAGSQLSLLLYARHGVQGANLELATVKYNNLVVCRGSAPPPPPPKAQSTPACTELLNSVQLPARPEEWRATLTIPVPPMPHAAAVQGWHLRLTFNKPVVVFSHNASEAKVTTVDDRNFIMRSSRGGDEPVLVLKLHVQHEPGASLALAAVKYNNILVCNASRYYDYHQALRLTLLFLETQQSGPLAADNRIPWRGDSCMRDMGNRGEDLTGGYFTGSLGRTVKFTFPNAGANTMLAWGMIAYKSAYTAAGEMVNGMAAVDWGARYLSRCYSHCGDVYAIVGDHMNEPFMFIRPESINFRRPVLALSSENPGSDLFGEVVAALASASVVLRDHWEGPQLAESYLSKARKLFDMAAANRGDYLRAMQLLTPNLVYTPRNGDECELIWAAVWMFRATAEPRYLELAQRFYGKLHFRRRPFTYYYWDDKAVGAMILLYQMTRNESYMDDARVFCDEVAFNTSRHTPRGLLRGLGGFASGLQLGAWASFACIQLGEMMQTYGAASSNPYLDFAKRQVHYALGDTGRSFLIGYGQNYPTRPNHIPSLCPASPAACDRSLWESGAVNEHELRGALVFGPDDEDRYEDSRHGVANNVDVVGNSGLSSALAALAELRAHGRLEQQEEENNTNSPLAKTPQVTKLRFG